MAIYATALIGRIMSLARPSVRLLLYEPLIRKQKHPEKKNRICVNISRGRNKRCALYFILSVLWVYSFCFEIFCFIASPNSIIGSPRSLCLVYLCLLWTVLPDTIRCSLKPTAIST